MNAAIQISLEQSRQFARLSGDFNPLHVDPLAARRLMFGSTVVHGIDILLRVIERALRETGAAALTALKASFGAPLRTGTSATVEPAEEADRPSGSFGYRVLSQGRVIQRVSLSIGPRNAAAAPVPATAFAPAAPQARDFAALAGASGTVPLGFDAAIARALYPALPTNLPPIQLAVLLATTRIVGMECPGLHSVYTELNLGFRAPGDDDVASLAFRVAKADARFNLLNIAIAGGGATGQMQALVRAAPAVQASFAQVQARVAASTKQGCRALVIGGGRGLGEITAKIVAAAGADVLVTYAAGAEDAARVANEIRAGGGRCDAFRLDVTSLPERPDNVPTGWAPDEIYYFASPHIEIRPGEPWNAMLFARLCEFYVTGLARTVAAIDGWFGLAGRPVKLFYPSSVFLDRPTRGAAEYAAAKAAGEQLCRDLMLARRGLTARWPRLPRMLTDQTAGLKTSEVRPALDVMLDILLGGSCA